MPGRDALEGFLTLDNMGNTSAAVAFPVFLVAFPLRLRIPEVQEDMPVLQVWGQSSLAGELLFKEQLALRFI